MVLPDDVPPGGLSERLVALGASVERGPLGVLRRRHLTPAGLFPWLFSWLAGYRAVHQRATTWQPDLIYSNTLAVTVGACVAGRRGTPHLWHVHEIIESPRWLARGLGSLARWSNSRVVAVSHAVADRLTSDGVLSVDVLHNGIPDPTRSVGATSEGQFSAAVDGPLVLMVGRMSRWKGALEFLELAENLIRRGSPAHFLLVGGEVPGDADMAAELRRRLGSRALAGRCSWLPFTHDVGRLFEQAALVVLPSVKPDPFPTVVLEAMYFGLPVVMFDHGGAREIQAAAGVLRAAPVGDVGGLADLAYELLGDPAASRALGVRAREFAEQYLTVERFQSGILDAMGEALDRSI